MSQTPPIAGVRRRQPAPTSHRQATCPECHQDAAIDEVAPFHLCPHCAAIGRRDGSFLRLCKTDEWLALVGDPEANALFDARERLLERLTRPTGSPA